MSTIFSGTGFPLIFLRKRYIHPISELQAAVGSELRILPGVMQYDTILITGDRGNYDNLRRRYNKRSTASMRRLKSPP